MGGRGHSSSTVRTRTRRVRELRRRTRTTAVAGVLGDEAQVGMMLPRCIQHMAGVGLDDGGFHQVLNRLFSHDPEFSGLRVEDKKAFRDHLRGLAPGARRQEALHAVRGLLIRAYRIVLGDEGIVTRVAGRLAGEMGTVSVEVGR